MIYALGIQSPKLRMEAWNLNTFRFGGDYTPQTLIIWGSVIGSLGMGYDAIVSSVRLTKADPDPTPTDPTEPVGPVSIPTAEQIKVDAPQWQNGPERSRGPKTIIKVEL